MIAGADTVIDNLDTSTFSFFRLFLKGQRIGFKCDRPGPDGLRESLRRTGGRRPAFQKALGLEPFKQLKEGFIKPFRAPPLHDFSDAAIWGVNILARMQRYDMPQLKQ